MYLNKLIYVVVLIIIYRIYPSIQQQQQQYYPIPYNRCNQNHQYDRYNTNQNAIFDGDTSKRIEFRIKLSNNTGARVYLSIQLLNNATIDESLTTTTTPRNSQTDRPKIFTIDEAIEVFRKDLIEKETNIGGIIQSSTVFYRHFNLKYENVEIRLICSYYSNYTYRKLNIYCFEYNANKFEYNYKYNQSTNEFNPLFEREENGINIRTLDVNDYLQTLHMSIQ